MSVQLTVLGSGSGGNATLVAHRSRGVLVDAGLSYRAIVRRLAEVAFSPDWIEAIVVTHAHGDHTRGARTFARHHAVPVYMTDAVYAELAPEGLEARARLTADRRHAIGGFRFVPVAIPHDASETVAFRIETPEGSIGLCTDIGAITPSVIALFRGCRVLIVESNHAVDLLRVSPYDAATRARIAGARGHLSNEALAAFVRAHLDATVRCVVLAHLSRVNNVPEIAEMTCREALRACGRTDVTVIVALQDRVAPTVDLATWEPRPRLFEQTPLPFGPDVRSTTHDPRLTTYDS